VNACAPFRAEVERALAGPAGALARLASHEHARACPACRIELARERALDGVLERMPAPAVPDGLARGVLARLAPERDGLPATVQAAPRGRGDDPLEEALARLPAPHVPADLSARILHGLAPARAERRARSWRFRWLASAAAVLVAVLALWGWSVLRRPARSGELAQGTDTGLEDDEDLLAYAVERWELLQDEDLDLWLAGLDPVDELLIEYADDQPIDEAPHGKSKED
jgi:hypothetical protein